MSEKKKRHGSSEREKRHSSRGSERKESREGRSERSSSKERSKRRSSSKEKERKHKSSSSNKEDNKERKRKEHKEKKRKEKIEEPSSITFPQEEDHKQHIPTRDLNTEKKSLASKPFSSLLDSNNSNNNNSAAGGLQQEEEQNKTKRGVSFFLNNNPNGTNTFQQDPLIELSKYLQNTSINITLQNNLQELQFLINSKLIPKKTELQNELFTLNKEIENIKREKNKIINEYKLYLNTFVNNIETQEQTKLSIYKQDELNLINELNDINFIINKLGNDLNQISKNIDFTKYIQDIQFITNKEIYLHSKNNKQSSLINFNNPMNDLEFYKINYLELQKLLKIKNEIITKLLIERDLYINNKTNELSQLYLEMKKELYEWMKMVNEKK
ncbi:hypothetical protein ABK040_004945 [Willaertia magna]